MFGRKEKKHQNTLYYLLPGMTRANRQKRKVYFWWSVVIGLVVAGGVGAVIWLVNRGPQP